MNTSRKIAASALVLAMAGTTLSPAFAFPAGGPGMGMNGGARGAGPMQMFDRFDGNGDGTITRDEVTTAIQQQIEAADTTGSGDLTLDEWKVAFADRAQYPQVRMFQRFDANGDGQITKDEFLAAADRMSQRRGPSGPRADRWDDDDDRRGQRAGRWDDDDDRRGQRAGRWDNDDDRRGQRAGRWSDDDDCYPRRGHGMKGHHSRMGHGPRAGFGGQMFANIDTNGDRQLSAAELGAYADTIFADGPIDLDGFKAVWAKWSEPMMVRSFQRMDANGDLKVTAEEMSQRATWMFDRMDRDGDGAINKADLGKMMQQRRDWDGKRGGWGSYDGRRGPGGGQGPRDGSGTGPRNGNGPNNN